MATENITIRIRAIDEATKTIQQVAESLTKLKIPTPDISGFENARVTIVNYTDALKDSRRELRRFKFEWLGIMFAGMAIERTFRGLVRRQFELWGISNELSSAWDIVMIPVMEKLSDQLDPLIDKFESLPDPIKEAIGESVFFGLSIGKVLAVLGQIVIAIQAFSLARNSFVVVASSVITFLGYLTPIAAIVWGIIDVTKYWGVSTRHVVGGIAKILLGIGGIIAMIMGAPPLLVAAVVGAGILIINTVVKHWDKIKEVTYNLYVKVKEFFYNMFIAIKDSFVDVWEWIKSLPQKIIDLFVGLVRRIKNLLSDMIPFRKFSFSFGSGVLGSFQRGGVVPVTGPYLLHAGEYVIPREKVGSTNRIVFSPTINVYANVSGGYDVRRLADELNKYWAKDFERLINSRGSI